MPPQVFRLDTRIDCNSDSYAVLQVVAWGAVLVWVRSWVERQKPHWAGPCKNRISSVFG